MSTVGRSGSLALSDEEGLPNAPKRRSSKSAREEYLEKMEKMQREEALMYLQKQKKEDERNRRKAIKDEQKKQEIMAMYAKATMDQIESIQKIQSVERGRQARKKIKRAQKETENAAMKIQAHIRGFLSRRETKAKVEHKEKEKSAMLIQRMYRGFQSRRDVLVLKLNRAATRIQSRFRSHLAKRYMAELKALAQSIKGASAEEKEWLKRKMAVAEKMGKMKNYKQMRQQAVKDKRKELIDLYVKIKRPVIPSLIPELVPRSQRKQKRPGSSSSLRALSASPSGLKKMSRRRRPSSAYSVDDAIKKPNWQSKVLAKTIQQSQKNTEEINQQGLENYFNARLEFHGAFFRHTFGGGQGNNTGNRHVSMLSPLSVLPPLPKTSLQEIQEEALVRPEKKSKCCAPLYSRIGVDRMIMKMQQTNPVFRRFPLPEEDNIAKSAFIRDYIGQFKMNDSTSGYNNSKEEFTFASVPTSPYQGTDTRPWSKPITSTPSGKAGQGDRFYPAFREKALFHA